MASIINRNSTYYAEFSDTTRTPKSRRFSLRTKDRGTARALLAKLERAERLDGWDPWTDDPADVLAPKPRTADAHAVSVRRRPTDPHRPQAADSADTSQKPRRPGLSGRRYRDGLWNDRAGADGPYDAIETKSFGVCHRGRILLANYMRST